MITISNDENINLSLVTVSRQEGVFDDKQTPIGSKLRLSSSFQKLFLKSWSSKMSDGSFSTLQWMNFNLFLTFWSSLSHDSQVPQLYCIHYQSRGWGPWLLSWSRALKTCFWVFINLRLFPLVPILALSESPFPWPGFVSVLTLWLLWPDSVVKLSPVSIFMAEPDKLQFYTSRVLDAL